MAVTRKVRHMNEDGTIVEADIGALAENVKEDAQRRFVSDTEKEKWNGHVAADGGDISETNITLEEQAADTKYPAMPTGAKKSKTTGGIFKRWLESLKTDKVDVSGGDISDTKIASVTTSTASYPVPAAGDTGKVFLGKIVKFFDDIRNAATGACFIGQIVNNCVSTDTNKPLSAAQGKYLMDLYNGLNTKTQNLDYAHADTREMILRFTSVPPASPGGIGDVIAACKYNGMCYQEDGTGPAPDNNPYCFYRCMNYGSVWVIICYVASTNKIFTGSLIGETWSGWSEK